MKILCIHLCSYWKFYKKLQKFMKLLESRIFTEVMGFRIYYPQIWHLDILSLSWNTSLRKQQKQKGSSDFLLITLSSLKQFIKPSGERCPFYPKKHPYFWSKSDTKKDPNKQAMLRVPQFAKLTSNSLTYHIFPRLPTLHQTYHKLNTLFLWVFISLGNLLYHAKNLTLTNLYSFLLGACLYQLNVRTQKP